MTSSSRTGSNVAQGAGVSRPDHLAGHLLAGSSLARRRRIGSALVGFGVVGLLLLVACVAALALSFAPLLGGATALDQQRSAALDLIGPAADTLETTATSAQNAGTSLGQSVAAARDAASVTGQLADAMQGLAAFSSAFADTANRSRALSDDLNRTADALSQNQTDSATAAAELRALSDRLRQLQSHLGTADSPPTNSLVGIAVPLALGLVALLLGWLAAIAIASIWLGRSLRSSPRPLP